jgi:hypothetical protein
LFLLVRERCLDIPKINPFVPPILAEVRNVSFGAKSHRVRIGPVELEKLLGSNLED